MNIVELFPHKLNVPPTPFFTTKTSNTRPPQLKLILSLANGMISVQAVSD